MLKTAYGLGMYYAFREAGMAKEAAGKATAAKGLAELARSAVKKTKDYVTLAKPRKAFEAVHRAGGKARTAGDPSSQLSRRATAYEKAFAGTKSEALKSLLPYATPAAAAGAGYAGYKGLQALFPEWEGIQPEPPSLWERLTG